jgi:hypothetical protein
MIYKRKLKMEITLGMIIATALAIGAYYVSIQNNKEKK